MSVCLNHQDRETEQRCSSCLKPVCDECVLKTEEGKFCSENCHTKAKKHFERAASMPREQQPNPLVQLLKLACYVGALGAILYFGWPYVPAQYRHILRQLSHHYLGL